MLFGFALCPVARLRWLPLVRQVRGGTRLRQVASATRLPGCQVSAGVPGYGVDQVTVGTAKVVVCKVNVSE